MLLDQEEFKIEVFRRHWMVMVIEFAVFLFIALAPVVGVLAFIGSSNIQFVPQMHKLMFFLTTTWILFVWLAFFVVYTNYYLDVWVLTNRRLIDAEQKSLFTREIAVLRLDNIQDAVSETRGIFATMFNYGDVHVQTAGSQKEFVIYDVHDPKLVRDQIMRAQEAAAREKQNVRIIQD